MTAAAMLQLGPGLALPLSAVTQAFAGLLEGRNTEAMRATADLFTTERPR